MSRQPKVLASCNPGLHTGALNLVLCRLNVEETWEHGCRAVEKKKLPNDSVASQRLELEFVSPFLSKLKLPFCCTLIRTSAFHATGSAVLSSCAVKTDGPHQTESCGRAVQLFPLHVVNVLHGDCEQELLWRLRVTVNFPSRCGCFFWQSLHVE